MKTPDELWACLSLHAVYINASTPLYLYHEDVASRLYIHVYYGLLLLRLHARL